MDGGGRTWGPVLKMKEYAEHYNRKESCRPLWRPEEPHSRCGWSHEGRLVGKRFPIALRKYYLFVGGGGRGGIWTYSNELINLAEALAVSFRDLPGSAPSISVLEL